MKKYKFKGLSIDERRQYYREYYAQQRDDGTEYFRRKKELAEKRIKETRKWFEDLKKTMKCKHCGCNHPATLDFHHRNPKEKEFSLGDICRNGYSKSKIIKEIVKCDVLCSNCHRIMHYDELS